MDPAANATASPPPTQITDTNKGPLIGVVTWLCLVMALLATVARIASKLILTGRVKIDDGLIVVSMGTAVAQSVIVLQQVSQGLGTKSDDFSIDQVDNILKFGYIANLLFITSIFLAKISMAVTTSALVQRRFQKYLVSTEGLIALWAGASLFVAMFECEMPRPWDYLREQCIDRKVFWIFVSAGNIATDVCIVLLLVNSIGRLQMNTRKKFVVLCVFGSRVLVIPAVAYQIMWTSKTILILDPVFELWTVVLCVQIVQAMSIITTCIPALKPFLDSLESGQLRADDMRRQGKVTDNGYTSQRLGESKHSRVSSLASPKRGTFIEMSNVAGIAAPANVARRSASMGIVEVLQEEDEETRPVTGTGGGRTYEMDREKIGIAWDGQSHTSQTVLITSAKAWDVDVEEAAAAEQRRSKLF
ncbi:hypothetical protein VHEMI04101 [[Torrubiella] hemipterigena]|uniref:Rhodopsin domain-containing protein n=1 Tax=[Torrubiella] hemipterigena TaxID=1531966 RepID=A0A0A1SUH2_9HYPO|nr:hypothetical protein VHEMI04101 [[Torrubiella] hemipterigena]